MSRQVLKWLVCASIPLVGCVAADKVITLTADMRDCAACEIVIARNSSESEKITGVDGRIEGRVRLSRGDQVHVYLQCPRQTRKELARLTIDSGNTVLDAKSMCPDHTAR